METNRYEPIKFDSWQELAKYVIDGGKVYYHENQEIKCDRGIFNFELTDNVMENLYIKKQLTLEELIAIRPRLCWVRNSVCDDKVLIIVDNYELLVSTWMYYEILTDDEIKQFLNGEQ